MSAYALSARKSGGRLAFIANGVFSMRQSTMILRQSVALYSQLPHVYVPICLASNVRYYIRRTTPYGRVYSDQRCSRIAACDTYVLS